MENQNVKRGRGRPPKYSTEEERKDALRRQKSKYMLDKELYCNICKTGRNYGYQKDQDGRYNQLITIT